LKEINKKPLEIKTPYPTKNDDWYIIHKRIFFEKWLDQYNHILEFTRTIIQLLALVLQIIIIWKIFQ